jgi:hypothetical protein
LTSSSKGRRRCLQIQARLGHRRSSCGCRCPRVPRARCKEWSRGRRRDSCASQESLSYSHIHSGTHKHTHTNTHTHTHTYTHKHTHTHTHTHTQTHTHTCSPGRQKPTRTNRVSRAHKSLSELLPLNSPLGREARTTFPPKSLRGQSLGQRVGCTNKGWRTESRQQALKIS